MKKWLKNSKGLTLVELLAVVVILGIVAAIAVPAIGKTISNSKVKADIGTYNMIKDAALRYSLDKQADGESGAITTEAVSNLKTQGYLTDYKVAGQSNSAITFDNYAVAVDSNGVATVTITTTAGKAITVTDGKSISVAS